jgi:hypothetical protein
LYIILEIIKIIDNLFCCHIFNFINPVYHDEIYCVALIFVGAVSVIFWIWTMYNMIQLVGYMENVDTKYNEVILELKDTKKLLKQEGKDARNRERRKS